MLTVNQVENMDREVRGLLKEIEDELSRIEHSGSVINERDVSNVQNKITQANNRLKTMDIELQSVPDRAVARKYKPVIKEHRKKIQDFEQQLQWTSAGKQVTTNNKYNAEDIANNEDAAIAYGNELHGRIDDAADRAINTVNETKEIAMETAQKVNEQTQQIVEIDKTLGEIDDEIQRASLILRRMGRRVMTDKYIWILVCLVMLAIIGVIVAAAVKKGKIKTSTFKA